MKSDKLSQLRLANLHCTTCTLRDGCRGVVFGEGSVEAPVMFVGEGPGQTEDELGRPFVGRAGQLLDRLLQEAGWARQDVYITNIVKCRPSNNRTPTPEEMEACLPWLRKQFAILRPRFMVLLGLAATHGILDKKLRMNQCRGQWFMRGNLLVLPTYHPAAVLRNPSWHDKTLADFKLVKQAVDDWLAEMQTSEDRQE